LAYPLCSNGQGGLNSNEVDWKRMSTESKKVFIRGWIEGANALYNDFLLAQASIIMRESGSNLSKCSGINLEIINKVREERGLDFFDIYIDLSIIQIVETIDKIYSDPRVRMWDIEDLMPITKGRLKGGWTEKDVDEVIAYLIKEKALSKKLLFYSRDEIERNKIVKELLILESTKPKALEAIQEYKTKIKW